MSNFITAEELRTIVINALVEEFSAEPITNVDEYKLPGDDAIMQASCLTKEEIAVLVVSDEPGKGDTPLLAYTDDVAAQMFF